jgi:HEAT repeat protein
MAALVKACIAEPAALPAAGELLNAAGDQGARAFAGEAIALGPEGLRVAEALLGRRLIDLLNVLAPSTPWFLLRPVAERLARAGEDRTLATLTGILRRGDEQARREVIEGLAEAGGAAVAPLLAQALTDPKADVAIVAARALGTSSVPGATQLLTDRLRELDLDGRDFLLAQAIIGSLARLPDPEAEVVLDRLSRRRQLIKRGHYTEVQELVREAIAYRSRGGA